MREIWQLLDSSKAGGIETHVAGLSRALRAAGDPVRAVFYADHGPHPLRDTLREAGVPVTVLPGGMRALLRAVAIYRPRLIHTHGYKAGILGRLAALALGVPVVHTFHAGEPGPGRLALWQTLDRWTSGLAAKRLAVSASVAASIPWRCEVVPNFVSMPAVAPAATGRDVVFLGRLSHEKGPDLFCEVALEAPSNLRFRVYGDGPMRAELEDRYGHRVDFVGFVADPATIWRETGLLVMPSRFEGLPYAALEAIAQGIPVAASRVGALPKLFEADRGWLFPAEDVRAANAAIRAWAMSTLEQRHARAAAAHASACQTYEERVVLNRLRSIYRDTASPVSRSEAEGCGVVREAVKP